MQKILVPHYYFEFQAKKFNFSCTTPTVLEPSNPKEKSLITEFPPSFIVFLWFPYNHSSFIFQADVIRPFAVQNLIMTNILTTFVSSWPMKHFADLLHPAHHQVVPLHKHPEHVSTSSLLNLTKAPYYS